jgi:hypothetical protein
MIGSENKNELALDNVAGIRKRSQARVAGGGGRGSGIRVRVRVRARVRARARAGFRLTTFACLIGRAGDGNQDGGRKKIGDLRSGERRGQRPAPNSRPSVGRRVAILRVPETRAERQRAAAAAPHGGEGILTRNGRILFSFGNWIAVFADHSCRQGIRCRMPDFYPYSISEFPPLNARSRTRHFFGLPGWGVPANLGPGLGIARKSGEFLYGSARKCKIVQ